MSLYRDRTTGAYPITSDTLRNLHPGVSFPTVITPEIAEAYGLDPVTPTVPPSQPLGQAIYEGAPRYQGGRWLQSWVLGPPLPDPPMLVLEAQIHDLLERVNHLERLAAGMTEDPTPP